MATRRITVLALLIALTLFGGLSATVRAQDSERFTVSLRCMRQGGPLEGVAEIVVRNWEMPSERVVLVSEFNAEQLVYLRDTAGGVRSQGRIVWRLGNLRPGEERRILWYYRILPQVQGEVLVRASVNADEVPVSSVAYRIQVVRVPRSESSALPEHIPPGQVKDANGLVLMAAHGQSGRLAPSALDESNGFYYLVTIRNEGRDRFNLRLVFKLSPQLVLDEAQRLGLTPLFTSPFVSQALRAEPLEDGRYRVLFPEMLPPGQSVYLKIPVRTRPGLGYGEAVLRTRLAWIAHDPVTSMDLGRTGELLVGHRVRLSAAEPAPPVERYRGPGLTPGTPDPMATEPETPEPMPEPSDEPKPWDSGPPPMETPSVPYPILEVSATAGKDGVVDRHRFAPDEPYYFLITLDNRSDPLLDVRAEIRLSEGLALDTSREVGLVSNRTSTKVLMPLDLEDLGENRYRLVKGGGLWLLGKRVAHILVPVKARAAGGETAEQLRIELTWKAHDPETKEYLNRKGEFATGAYTWIEEK